MYTRYTQEDGIDTLPLGSLCHTEGSTLCENVSLLSL